MRGKVTEKGSGRPDFGRDGERSIPTGRRMTLSPDPRSRPVETAADGSFELPVLPRSGLSRRPGRPPTITCSRSWTGACSSVVSRAFERVYAHAFVACDPKPGGETQGRDRREGRAPPGVTVKGQVVGPDGQPVVDAWMLSRIHLSRNSSPAPNMVAAITTAPRATAGSSCTGSIPIPRFPCRSSNRSASWARPSASRASQAAASRSSSSSSRAPRPRRGWSGRAASRSPDTNTRDLISMVVTPGEFFARQGAERRHLARRPRFPDSHRPDQLPEGPGVRRPGPDRVPRADPGRDVSHHRPHHGPNSERPSASQGVHRQARRDARPGRYPDRETRVG